MLKYSIRKSNSNNHWEPFILRDIYLSPDMSFISGITDTAEPIETDSKILVKKKDDKTYNEYFVTSVKSAIISGRVIYSRELPETQISRVVDYFDTETNSYSKKVISGTYVAYNDAVYYKYQYAKTTTVDGEEVEIPLYGYFINDRLYTASTEASGIVIDEIAYIEDDRVVIDNHVFQVFSNGISTDQWSLRYNEESGPLEKINGSGFTVELNTDPSTHEHVQKIVLYKNADSIVNVDDIQAGGYKYYVNIDNKAYDIIFNEEYDRYGIDYNGGFYPLTRFYDDNPFLPHSYNESGAALSDVSGTTRCMPPFYNHIVRVTQENGDISSEGVWPFIDYPVLQNLETDPSGDFLIMMTSDENIFEKGDKIVAKSNGAIQSTIDLEYESGDTESYFIIYNGKRYDAIEHGYDTISVGNEKYVLVYYGVEGEGVNRVYSAYCEIDGDIVDFIVKPNSNNELIAYRDEQSFIQVQVDNLVKIDNETYMIVSEYDEDGPHINYNGSILRAVEGRNGSGDKIYVIPTDDVVTFGSGSSAVTYPWVFDNSQQKYGVKRNNIFFAFLGTRSSDGRLVFKNGNISIYGSTNYYIGEPEYNSMTDYVRQSYSGITDYINETYGNTAIWDSGYTVDEAYAIRIGVNYYKVDERLRLYNSGNTEDAYGASTIYTVTITEPETYKFVVTNVLGSGTLLLDAYSDNFLYEKFKGTTNGGNVADADLTAPYYAYGITRIADNWDKFTFYILDDVFGEESVTPESGLIKLHERFEPTSSWDINRIKDNLNMYHSVEYLNITLPITSCVMPNPSFEDLRSNVFVNEYADAHVNKIVDMEKIPFRLADKNGKIINRLSINAGDYDFGLHLNERGIVPTNVKNTFIRMSFYDSTSTQGQELIGTMCLFFGGASISGCSGTDGLIYEKLNQTNVYSVYDPSIRKNSSSEGLTLYAFRYNYDVIKEMTVYMKMELYSAITGKVTPLFPFRASEIPLKNLPKSLYFEYTLKYDEENGYLFTPSDRSLNSYNICWQTDDYNNIHGGILRCKKPVILDESGLEPNIGTI